MTHTLTRELAETRADRHGNVCEIYKISDYRNGSLRVEEFTVRYAGSKRSWINRQNGSPYFASLASARAKIDRN